MKDEYTHNSSCYFELFIIPLFFLFLTPWNKSTPLSDFNKNEQVYIIHLSRVRDFYYDVLGFFFFFLFLESEFLAKAIDGLLNGKFSVFFPLWISTINLFRLWTKSVDNW